jgi:probable phosphoglycerate mutase
MHFPGGESIRAAQARAVDATETLAAEHRDETIVCVSHADVIKAVVAHHLAMPLDAFQRLVVAPASATVLALPAEGHPLLLTFNDTGELPAPPAPPAASTRKGTR